MKKEETKVLVKKKTSEGQSEKQAYAEVNDLKKSQKIFKQLNSKINKLEKENAKLKKVKEKKQKKAFLQGLGQDPEDNNKKFNGTFANTAHLKRILRAVEEQKNMTEISKECLMTSEQTKSGLRFLTKHNLVKKAGGKYFK